MALEQRHHRGGCEVRSGSNGQPMIVGYAAVFNRDSEDLGGFIEQVDPGCFTKTLREADVRALGNHQVDWLLGRTKAGTARLEVDSVGLRYEVDINEADPDGVRALEKVRRGDWDGSSFSFQVIRDEWDWSAEPVRRSLLETKLIDVGPVTFPAYPDSSVAARALAGIAQKTGRAVDELVTGLATGEIRSMVGAAPAEEPVPATTSTSASSSSVSISFVPAVEGVTDEAVQRALDALDEEARAGKTLSASTVTQIRDAIEKLEALIDAATGTPDDEPDDAGRGLSIVTAEAMLTIRERDLRGLQAA